MQAEHEEQIASGALALQPCTDAVTLVLGKEKGGFLKGIGYGLTTGKYWGVGRVKGSYKERIAQLEHEAVQRDELVNNLTNLVESTKAMLARHEKTKLEYEARFKHLEGLLPGMSAIQVSDVCYIL